MPIPTSHELETFFATWEQESRLTAALLRTLPSGQYDFRPDAGGRSLGELAWHLAEVDGWFSFCIDSGEFRRDAKVPNMERPRAVEALASGYERIHQEAVARLRRLTPADLDRVVPFMGGRSMSIRDLLWYAMLHHAIHHRGQLTLMNRLAGGVSPGPYGPNREDSAAMRARASA